jgi:hypothetical protein
MGQKWDPEEVFYFNVTTIDEDYNDRLDFTLQLRTDTEYGHKWWTQYQAHNVQVCFITPVETTTFHNLSKEKPTYIIDAAVCFL